MCGHRIVWPLASTPGSQPRPLDALELGLQPSELGLLPGSAALGPVREVVQLEGILLQVVYLPEDPCRRGKPDHVSVPVF